MNTDTTTVIPFPGRDARRSEAAPRSGVRPAGVRLEPTRRGRMLVTVAAFLLGLAVALIAVLVLDVPSALAGAQEDTSVTVTVASGETLWQLAEEHAPEGVSHQEYISQVRTMNHLPTGRVTAGQQLELPIGEGVER